MPKIELINDISMNIFGPFFYPFLAFGYIWGQIPIVCHMRIYKLCIHAKNYTHKWYFYGHFSFLPFFYLFGSFFDPFLTFGYIWGQIPIDCHMHIYKLYKHAKNCTHTWYFYVHFKVLPFFYLFVTLFRPLVIFGVKFL